MIWLLGISWTCQRHFACMASLVQVNKGEGVTFQNPIEDEDEDKDENKKKRANDREQKIETKTMEMKSKMMLYLACLLQVAPAQP